MHKKWVMAALLCGLLLVFGGLQVAAAQDQVTITYALWDNSQLPAVEQIIAAFEAQNPSIKVEPQVVPWSNYWDKLQTAVAGGEAYDVFWMNGPNFPVYASKGVLMDLQDRITSESIDMSVYPESLVNLYTYDGHSYAFPRDFDTIGLYYNKDVFDEMGVAYPTADWTWDDLKQAAAALTNADHWGFAASVVDDQAGFWNFIYQNGGSVISADGSQVTIDQPAACDAIKYLYSFVQDGTSPDGATMQASYPPTDLFPSGKVAMVTAGSWMVRTYAAADAHIDVAPLPMGTQRATIIHGLGTVVWSGTQHPEEAWAFAKYLGSEEAELILAQSGTVIPAYNGLQQDWVDAVPSMNLQAFIDELDYAVPYPTAASGMEWSAQIDQVLADVWAGNISIDDACTEAASAGNTVLQQAE